MNIWVPDELQCIKEELMSRGYNVISKEVNVALDAIICNLKEGDLLKLNGQIGFKREGTLIIDSGSKSIDEIEYILNNRIYNVSL